MLERYFLKPETVDGIRRSWLGHAIERYVSWLDERGFSVRCVHRRVPLLMRFAVFAEHHGTSDLRGLAGHLDAFARRQLRHRIQPCRSTAARRKFISDIRQPIQQFLRVLRVDGLEPGERTESRPLAHWTPHFFDHLHEERGLRPTTIRAYEWQLREFERYVRAESIEDPQSLTPAVLDQFLAARRTHVCARSLTGTCAALRTWLRYLYRERLVKRDLSVVVEGPHTYRLSGIVRSITAEEVHRTLEHIDRRSAVGKRDYAMILLLVVYGLRAREVAALTLDEIDWRTSVLHVRARKAGHAATYPLAVEVGEGLLDYLQHGRPHRTDRHVFLQTRAPYDPVRYTIVGHRATAALRRAGITVARPGSHTLRHSCAQRLVDANFSLKVIGDYLGHRRASSTRIYSKVSLEALRDVALGHGEELA